MYSDDEKDNLNQSYGSGGGGSGGISSSGGLNISNQNDSSSGSEFINQMEQVFKTIDTEENGVISLSQLRNEIEDITGESIDSNNPLIGKLLNFLRIVHRVEQPKDDDDDNEHNGNEDSDGSSFEDDNSFEDMELNERKQNEEENTFIDFQSFIESMASYMDGNDPKQVRLKQIEKLKLPKFKVPIELLKKYNITPKYLSPMINGSPNSGNNGNGGGNNLLSPSNISGGNFSHLNSPTKNKFGRMFTPTKPIVTFDQFNTLITKLNYGKEIPKQKLLMHLHDLQTDTDDCIDANQFLSRFGGLNHPMSPKLTYDDDILEKKEDQFNINSRGAGNTSPTHNLNHSSGGVSSPSVVQWKQNSQIVDQLQDSYKQLEKECESFQSEVSMLEKSRQIQDAALRKKDQEIDRLRKDARFADGMRDANKDLMVQNTNLKTQLSKLTQNEEFLRETMDQEKDRLRELNESNVLKELEVKKLKLLLKTQQNINNKLSMMVTFSDDSLQDGGGNNGNGGGSVNFTSKRIKPTIDRAKQVLNRQKSDKFEIDKYSTIHANNNFSMFLQQQQLQQQALQQQQQQQQQLNTSGANSPHSLQYEFEQLQQQSQQSQSTPTLQSELSNTSIDEGSELDSLKKQLSGFDNGDFELPSDYDDSPIVDLNINNNNSSNNNSISFESPALISSPVTSNLLSRVSEGPQPIHMMTPISPNIIIANTASNNQTPVSPLKDHPSNRSLTSSKYIGTSSPNIKSPSSAPMYSTPSPNSLLSPFNLNNNNSTVITTSFSNTNSPVNNMLHHSGTNTIGRHNQVVQDQFNVGSIRRLKKSDIIRLHTSEMEEQNESAQLLITEAASALEEFKKNSTLELQRLQKLYQEEKQHNKILEKQLSLQLDKNKEMVTGKEGSSGTWGGMQNFFSFVSNYLPSTLFCNLSNTS